VPHQPTRRWSAWLLVLWWHRRSSQSSGCHWDHNYILSSRNFIWTKSPLRHLPRPHTHCKVPLPPRDALLQPSCLQLTSSGPRVMIVVEVALNDSKLLIALDSKLLIALGAMTKTTAVVRGVQRKSHECLPPNSLACCAWCCETSEFSISLELLWTLHRTYGGSHHKLLIGQVSLTLARNGSLQLPRLFGWLAAQEGAREPTWLPTCCIHCHCNLRNSNAHISSDVFGQ
jgi:hypothetical protein